MYRKVYVCREKARKSTANVCGAFYYLLQIVNVLYGDFAFVARFARIAAVHVCFRRIGKYV